jgi:hypothetical protein
MSYSEDEYQRGRKCLTYFHNKMISLYPKNVYPFSFNELISFLTARTGQKFFVQGLGFGSIEESERNIQSGMETLARNGKGKIPLNNNSFYQAIANDVGENISYIDASVFTAKETAIEQGKIVLNVTDDVLRESMDVTKKVWDKSGDILEAAADSTTSILKNAKWLLPALLFFGVGIYVYVYAKGSSKG